MFNPLDYPVCLSYPLRLASTAWAGHVPFAMLLTDLLRPGIIVELGTFTGVSYSAFCQAVKELDLNTRCYAVDTWEGDPQSGYYGAEVLENLKQHHDPLYGHFSTLIQSSFDEALQHFADGAIDLLHIDGYHTYEVVRHDFENWLPKLSQRGVILFHDIEVRQGEFGVWKLWQELKQQYPHFEFTHEHGLGLLAAGEASASALKPLLELPPAQKNLLRRFFYQLGQRLNIQLENEHAVKSLAWQVEDKEKINQSLTTQLAQQQETIKWLTAQVKARDEDLGKRDQAAHLLQNELEITKQEVARLATLTGELTAQVDQYRQAQEALEGQLLDKDHLAQELLMQKQQNAAAYQDRLAEQHEKVAALQDRLTQAKEQEALLAQRQEAILRLQTGMAQAHQDNGRLASANQLLQAQLAEKAQAKQLLTRQLDAKERQLQQILNTLGWRLLSRYGAIKYRYLLPVYRLLGLLPTASSSSLPPQALPLEIDAAGEAEPTAQDFTGPAAEGELIREVTLPEAAPQVAESWLPKSRPKDFYEAIQLLPHLREDELPAIFNHRPPAKCTRKPDVICFSIIDWEFRYQRPQQLMSQFAAQGHRVFYISTTRFLPDSATPRICVSQIKENVYEVQLAAVIAPDVYGRVIQGANQGAMLESLEELRRTFHIDAGLAYVMISSWGDLALEAGRLWKWRIIYDCMDEWENFPGIKQALLDMEVKLVRQCDLLVVTAQRLYEKWLPYNRPMVLARNGVDMDFYAEHYRPNRLLSEVAHPLIGYYGAIADWFDVELMVAAARARPHYNFVLLGGVFDVDVTDLEALPNVHLLGQQAYETMPQYLFHFDACIIPFKINPITEATDPVKLYEYLSAGKPVVSVALAELLPFSEYLYLARDDQDFVAQLDRALAENDTEAVVRRRAFSALNTWETRYRQIKAGLDRVTPRASIIIVTYNNLALTKLCLESIIRNTEYLNYELIVVDNHSLDGTPAYLRYMASLYPNLSIILNQENHGFARANNQGIAQSTGDYLVLLNNDTVVPPGWLNRLLSHLQNPAVGMVGPMTNFVGNEARIEVPYQTWGEMQDFAREHTWEHDGKVADIHMLAMFCVAMRRATFEEIGPLDEQFGIGMFEDDDYAQRLKQKGYRVVCAADVFVHHFGQAAFKKLIETGAYNPLFDENRQRYESKWKVKWIPHKHAPLKFETPALPTRDFKTVEQKG